MQVVEYPSRAEWPKLLRRPVMDMEVINERVRPILQGVQSEGDQAVKAFTEKFDGVKLGTLAASEEEFKLAEQQVDQSLKEAIRVAYDNIFAFHSSQELPEKTIQTMEGVKCWRKSLPIEKVGLYIPGGTAPLFSTILMLGIPAKIAAC